METIYALWNNSIYNLLSVFSQDIIIVPIVGCILIAFISFLLFSLVRK